MVEWTAVLVALIGAGGIAGILEQIRRLRSKPGRDKNTEDRAVGEVGTPAAPGISGNDLEAIRLAQQAMNQVTSLSEKLCSTESRLGEVERELGMFRRSYRSLYWWVQKLLYDWDTVREHPDPPPIPEDIHHPDS